MIYADYNATAPLRPEARDAMLMALEIGANPSSVHRAGRSARRVVETARRQLAQAIGALPQDIVFTSGGTEAIAMALNGVVRQLDGKCTLLVSAIEHDAVSRNAGIADAPVRTVYVDPTGAVDLNALKETLKAWDTDRDGVPVLVLMLANNETGVVQPVQEAAAMVREAGGLTLCDSVQGLGKIPVNVSLLGADYLTFSAHKLGGPQGVGALWMRSGAPLRPSLLGGGQERSLRSGTENLSGIAGFGAAAEIATASLRDYQRLSTWRDAMEARLEAEAGVTVFGKDAERLPNTSNFALGGFKAETQVMAMDLAGVAVSSGSACSSGKVKRSVVLSAMGAADSLAECAIRTSFGWRSSQADFEATADAWLKALQQRRTKETA